MAAAKKKVAVFVIAPNKTLEALAQSKPLDLDSIRAVTGMGHWRTENYGDEFLKIIQNWR